MGSGVFFPMSLSYSAGLILLLEQNMGLNLIPLSRPLLAAFGSAFEWTLG